VQHRQQELTALQAQNAQLQETLAQRKETIMARLTQLEREAHVAPLANH
jgi:flagellar biosynthesis/type III secretory pathway chaperone